MTKPANSALKWLKVMPKDLWGENAMTNIPTGPHVPSLRSPAVTTVHRLTGYDKVPEKLVAQFDIPETQFGLAKSVTEVGSDDPEAALSYPLKPEQAKRIAQAIGQSVDADRLLWFLEPFADWENIRSEQEKLRLRE